MPSQIRVMGLLIAGLAAAAISCQRSESPGSGGSSSSGTNASNSRQVYAVKGVVRQLLVDKKKAKIAHETIPGYMDAMTMLFDVKEARDLEGLKVGDNISFQMVVTSDDGWIESIKKLDGQTAAVPASEPEAPIRRLRNVEPLAVGDMIPEYTFTNMLGGVTRLSELKGKAVVFTFIFTRCPFPTFCPRLNMAFKQAHDKLQAMRSRLGEGELTNWMMLSITMDPDYDTPARLKEYSRNFRPDEKHWLFVTGDIVDITAIGEQFGLQFWRPAPNDPITHNMRTVVLDTTGRVQWITNESEFKPDDLVAQIVKAASVR